MDNSQLHLVREKELRVKKTLSKQLASAAALAHGEQQQIGQLQSYQSDYFDRIEKEQSEWPVEKSQHYREFCYHLTQVISEQKEKFEKTTQRINELRVAIEQQQKKVEVIDNLIEKEAMKQLAMDNKRAQNETDALVARRYFN